MARSTIAVPLQQLGFSQSILDGHLSQGPLPPFKPVSLPVANPTRSFWIDSPGANPLATVGSEGDLTEDADICIVGAGITGVSAAYHLARMLDGPDKPNTTVVILEARDFCSGATGRNGGHLTPSIFLDFHRRQLVYGRDEALKAYELENYTSRELLKIARGRTENPSANLDVRGDVDRQPGGEEDVDLVEGGHMTLFVTQAEEDSARLDFETAKAAGLNRLDEVQWIDKETMEKTRGASFPGVKMPGHNLWPLKLVTRLYNLSRSHSKNVNVRLHTRTPVTAVRRLLSTEVLDANSQAHHPKHKYSVVTPRGSLTCSYVLHATNGYANHLLSPEKTRIRIAPTRGQIIGLRANASQEKLGRTSWDANEGFEYWFPRPVESQGVIEDRPLVILGGGREVSGPKFEYFETDDREVNEVVGHALRDFLPNLFPGMYDGKYGTEWEWTGIMGYTQSGHPFVGPVSLTAHECDGNQRSSPHDLDGQYIAAGYTGHGMPRAFACAEAAAGMIVADLGNRAWAVPTWFPNHYHTTSLLSK